MVNIERVQLVNGSADEHGCVCRRRATASDAQNNHAHRQLQRWASGLPTRLEAVLTPTPYPTS